MKILALAWLQALLWVVANARFDPSYIYRTARSWDDIWSAQFAEVSASLVVTVQTTYMSFRDLN